MSSSTPLSGVNQPLRGIALVVVATFLFASHDALSKFLGGLYPIIMVVWVRYLVHTLLMAGIFLPSRAWQSCVLASLCCRRCAH